MRAASMLRPLLFAAALSAAVPTLLPALAMAQGDDKIFVVDMSDGYGVDTCVANGGTCGQAIADADIEKARLLQNFALDARGPEEGGGA